MKPFILFSTSISQIKVTLKNDLLQTVIDFSGGLKKWNAHDNPKADLQITGTLFVEKEYAELVKNKRSIIKTQEGKIPQGINSVQNFFEQPALDSSWTMLQMLYFGSASLCTAMIFPFNLSLSGFQNE